MTAIFVTGTDTGVGKTYITSLMAESILARGRDVAVVKPYSTGSGDTDPQVFKRIKGLRVYNFARFRLPLSPYQAAMNEGKKMNFNDVIGSTRSAIKRHEVTLVEGIGGVFVPLDSRHMSMDIARSLRLKTIVVTTPWLGTINHTLLTVRALQQAGVEISAVLVNANKRWRLDKYHRQIPAILRRLLAGIRVAGILPFGAGDARALIGRVL